MYARSQTWIGNGLPPVLPASRRRGLGAAPTIFVAAQPGVSQAVSDQACRVAGGSPVDALIDANGVPSPAGCDVPTVPELPGWCSFPGAASLFDACDMNAVTQANANAYGIYTVGQGTAGPSTGIDQAKALADAAAAVDAAQPLPDCSYWAAANQPLLSNFLGPSLVGSLMGRSESCQADPNAVPAWVLYGGALVLGLALWGALK